ncbi:LruC domain-containing protein [uncultured Bacteroides sp.]|uniref:LruC domain-containing protein n=1 Tax=uncultured Bacteroides sp. TaxID=162156 RepID=UPI002AABBDE0|nr:LruC domain-containing protein [uncultured Bacteroides sp.]
MRISTPKITTILFFFTMLISTYSCKEDYYDPYYVAPSPFTGVPDNFDWSTISSINLTVNVNDEYKGTYYYIVEVFNDNPIFNANATLLAKGVAKEGEAYSSEVNFPQALQTIYVRQTGPNGLKIVQERTIDAKNITVNFAGNSSTAGVKSKAVTTRSTAPAYQGVRDGATLIDLKASSKTLTAGKSYVITGGTYSGNIIFGGGSTTTLFVEGEWNVPSGQSDFKNGLEVVVLNGGKITFNSSSQTIKGNGANLFIMAGGAFNSQKKNININFTNSGGNIYNAGEFYLNQMSLNGGLFYNNSSTVSIAEFTQTGTIENHGVLTLGTINATSGFILDNYCNIKVTGGITTSVGTFYLHGSTILSCVYFDPKGTTINMEAYSLFDVTGTATFNSWTTILNGPGSDYNYDNYYSSDFALARIKNIVCNGSKNVYLTGNLELECSKYKTNGKGIYLYYPAHMVSYGDPTVLIPASECTGKGSYPAGTAPQDPVFPIEVPTSSVYTYAIEDYWPAYGDYDMNDLVVESQTSYWINLWSWTTSVSSMTITARIMAVGGTKKLSAAFQLDRVPASSVASVSVVTDSPNNRLNGKVFTIGSTGTETGQAKAVIPLFDEAHHFLLDNASERYDLLNTSSKAQYITPKQVTITINFKYGTVSPSDIAVKYLNFFAVTDAKAENRKEVHLPGYAPTDKAIQSFFGGGPNNIPSNNDLSLNGVYYRGTDNLIWGLMIPGTFNYPEEYASILKAYPKFKSWATSGGTTSQDWYSSENADNTYIYTKN